MSCEGLSLCYVRALVCVMCKIECLRLTAARLLLASLAGGPLRERLVTPPPLLPWVTRHISPPNITTLFQIVIGFVIQFYLSVKKPLGPPLPPSSESICFRPHDSFDCAVHTEYMKRFRCADLMYHAILLYI